MKSSKCRPPLACRVPRSSLTITVSHEHILRDINRARRIFFSMKFVHSLRITMIDGLNQNGTGGDFVM